MSQLDLEAVNPTGPILGQIRAILGTGASARTDLSALAEIGPSRCCRVLTFQAEGADWYIAFSATDAGTVDETNTTAGNATQCAYIPVGTFRDFRIPYTKDVGLHSWLVAKSTSAGKLRIFPSSESPLTRV